MYRQAACRAIGCTIASAKFRRGIEKWSSRQPHKLEIFGSNPAPATIWVTPSLGTERGCKPCAFAPARFDSAVTHHQCGRSSSVEHDLAKVGVEGSTPFVRSNQRPGSNCGQCDGLKNRRSWFDPGLGHQMEKAMTPFERWLQIKPHLLAGLNDYQVAPLVGVCRQRVTQLRHRFAGNDITPPPKRGRSLHNWMEIQAAHDAGETWRGLSNRFGVSMKSLMMARDRGELTTRSLSKAGKLAFATGRSKVQPMSEERRAALSEEQSRRNRGGKSKWFEVGGVMLQGTWERDFALKLSDWGVDWVKVSSKRESAWP